jgi:transposase
VWLVGCLLRLEVGGETAKMCRINPQAYLADVLNRIADHPIRQIDTLLPWRWAK